MKNLASIALIILLSVAVNLYGCKDSNRDTAPQQQPPAGKQLHSLNVEEQINTLREIIAKEPENTTALIRLGNIFMDTKRCKEAITYYTRALRLEPENADVRVDLGTCYRRTGQPEKAIEEYRKAIEINPGHPYAHRNYAVVLAFDLNKPVEAIGEFQTYLRLSPDAPDADQIKKIIIELSQRKQQ